MKRSYSKMSVTLLTEVAFVVKAKILPSYGMLERSFI